MATIKRHGDARNAKSAQRPGWLTRDQAALSIGRSSVRRNMNDWFIAVAANQTAAAHKRGVA
jgi:hypothetical protein